MWLEKNNRRRSIIVEGGEIGQESVEVTRRAVINLV